MNDMFIEADKLLRTKLEPLKGMKSIRVVSF